MAAYSLMCMRITWDFSESFTDSCFTLVVFLLCFSTLLCVITLVSLQVRKIKVPFLWLNSRLYGLHMLTCE